MALIPCKECGASMSEKAIVCLRCGCPLKPIADVTHITSGFWRGFEWKSKAEILEFPLIHVAIGRDRTTGKLLVARGIIAIGQFGIGLITIAQFGIGFLFGFGQFIAGFIVVAQFALAAYFGIGQFATGLTACGQFAFGKYVLAQKGVGTYVWSHEIKDPAAKEYFKLLWSSISGSR